MRVALPALLLVCCSSGGETTWRGEVLRSVAREARGAKLVDRESGVGLRFELASPDPMTLTESAIGVEDRVLVEDERTSIAYSIELQGDAHLRHVDDVIEVLDHGGAPRTRITARAVFDAHGDAHPAKLSLEGCAADEDPRPPWNRPTVDPGALACTVRVAWAPDLARPVTVDPGWTTTKGTLTTSRTIHTMTTLVDGRVLLVGGIALIGGSALKSAEIFDPVSRTFAATGSLKDGRYLHSASLLLDGRVFVCGGYSDTAVLTSCEIWSPMSGGFTGAANMNGPRGSFAIATMQSGDVLIAGGDDGKSDDSAEVYFAQSNKFGPLIQIDPVVGEPPGRYGVTLTNLPDGDVLVAGGTNFYNTPESRAFKACRLFHQGAFQATGSMIHSRLDVMALPLPNGNVWLGGGYDRNNSLPTDVVEIYDWKSRTFSDHGKLLTPIAGNAVVMPSGMLVVVGGNTLDPSKTSSKLTSATQLYDPIADTSFFGPALSLEAWWSAATLPKGPTLPHGGVLAAGGTAASEVVVDVGEVLELGEKGDACKQDGACTSDRCAVRCCASNSACTGTCRSCVPVTGECGNTPRFEDDLSACTGETTCDGHGGCAKKNGRTCGAGSECASGFCVEGFCCDTACDDACGSCALDGRQGTCKPLPTGSKPKSDCGLFAGCSGTTTTCTSPTCASATVSVAVDGQSVSCEPYMCGPSGACLVSCKTSSDCVAPSVCDRGRCRAPRFDTGVAGCDASGGSGSALWLVLALLLIRRRKIAVLALLFFPRAALADNWDIVGTLITPRDRAEAVELKNGNVWIAGGCKDPGMLGDCDQSVMLSSSEIFDGKTVIAGPDIGAARFAHTLTVLQSGKVLVYGGCKQGNRGGNEGCDAMAAAMLCDVPGSCAPIPGAAPRAYHTATLMSDGRVLIAGGCATFASTTLSTTQIYDPAMNAFSAGPTLSTPRAGFNAVLLQDGRALLMGGYVKGVVYETHSINNAEIVDLKMMSTKTISMSNYHAESGAFMLPSGQVVIAGGASPNNGATSTADIFDPMTEAFTQLPMGLTGGDREFRAAYLSGVGKAVIALNFSNTYDPKSGFGDLSQLASPVYDGAFTTFGASHVIVAGGRSFKGSFPPSPTIQMFTLRSDGAPCEKDTDCNDRNCIDHVCCATECDGICVGCTAGTGACAPIARAEHATCSDDRQCDGAGACKKKDGRGCGSAAECTSGFCVDGVCCENACNGSCVACDRAPAGKCLPIVGLPAAGHPSCPAGKACGGASADCVPSICDGDHTIRAGDKTIDCTPYKCAVTGQCLDRCGSIQHCVAPYSCTDKGLCDKPAFDTGASCAVGDGGSASILALILALIKSRRARRAKG